jgi:MoaA/NifB/PqqE/SkfB family radical SAM enzyme
MPSGTGPPADHTRGTSVEPWQFAGPITAAPARRTGPPAVIPSVDWWVTSRCNLACDFCYGPEPGRDPAELRDAILEKLRESSASAVTFCGGEPLLVRKVDEYAGILAKAGKQTVLNTNGSILARRVAQGFGLEHFGVVGLSIDGSTPDVHRAMRGPRADLAEALSAADLVVRQPGTRLKIGTVVSAVNSGDLPGLAQLMLDLQPDVWRLYQYSSRGWQNTGQQRHHLAEEDFLRLAERAADLVAPIPVAFSTESQTAGCLIVDPAGTVLRPGESDYEECGNCLKEPLDDIWSRSPARSLVTSNKRWLSVLTA